MFVAPPGPRSRIFPTPLTAVRLDAAAARMARSRGALDLAVGEVLARLFRGDRLLQLGYAREVDYARERLGVPPRTMYSWLRLARGLADRPFLRRAVRVGAVTARKALAVLPVATGDAERAWTAAAMTRPLGELEEAVRAEGATPGDDFEIESLVLRMTAEEQDRLDTALALADELFGFGAPRWQRLEAICQEWLGTHGDWTPGEGKSRAVPPVCDAAVARRLLQVEASLAGLEEEGPGEEEAGEEDAVALDARVMRLLATRRGFDEAFGAVAGAVVGHRVPEHMGFRSLAEYCRDRLGIAPRSFRERVWLERRMCALPPLRVALRTGRITYSKALLVAKDATPADVGRRIEEATSTTWQQLERESTAAEERRNRAAGVRRLWGPKDAAETVAAAIASAQAWAAARGGRLDAGAALAAIADHFVAVWTAHLPRRRLPRARREVLLRHGGLCAVPGCSRPAQHEHHITFRARGGSNDTANRVALCAGHHLHGVHRGYLLVAGRAGERLEWRLGRAGAAPGGFWITYGDDDVRRAGKPAALAPAVA